MIEEEVVRTYFKQILENYNLEICKINNHIFFLYSNKYILIISISRDGVNIKYVKRNSDGKLEEFQIDSFISEKFDEIDRKDIGYPETIYDIVLAELKIVASGLERHFNNLLKGEIEWIDDFMTSSFDGAIREPNSVNKLYIEKMI